MATATTTVTCNAETYTQLTTASTGYALIMNPSSAITGLHLYNGAAAPAPATEAILGTLEPGQGYQRTSDITDHIWGKLVSNGTKKIAVTQ